MATTNPVQRVARDVDEAQRSRPWTAFPVAVFRKFGEDDGGQLVALLTYFGFVSLLPLLLVLVTGLGWILGGSPDLQRRFLDSALSQIPILGDQLQQNVHSLHGNWVALLVGLVGAIWGGLGVARTAQDAMNRIWAVPRAVRPGFVPKLLRSLLIVAVLGVGIVLSAGASALATAIPDWGIIARVGVFVPTFLIDALLVLAAYRILTAVDVAWRDMVPGALLAALGFLALQTVGTVLVQHQLANATQTYGFFGIVLGLLSFLALASQVLLIGAEVNVVRARHLWPRTIVEPPTTDADRRVLASYAKQEERRPEEEVHVDFDGTGPEDGHGADAPEATGDDDRRGVAPARPPEGTAPVGPGERITPGR